MFTMHTVYNVYLPSLPPLLVCVCVCVCSYEYLRMAFSELRGQLMHLTGSDPLMDHPLGGIPIKVYYYIQECFLLCSMLI